MIETAQHRKPQIQAFADQISRVFVPCIILIALGVWLLWAAVAAAGAAATSPRFATSRSRGKKEYT